MQDLINYHQAGRWLILFGSPVAIVLFGTLPGLVLGKGVTLIGSLVAKFSGKNGEKFRISVGGVCFEISKSTLTTVTVFIFTILGTIFVYSVVRDVATTEFPNKIG